MKETIKKAFLGGIVFLGTVITGFIGFAAWTDLPTQTNGDTLNSTIWNNLVTTVNNIGKSQLGVDQTRQNMDLTNTSSPNYRTSGAIYTNTTGKPITVSIFPTTVAGFVLASYVNGVRVSYLYSSSSANLVATYIVPNNAQYYTTVSAGTINTWVELRQ
ncbi:MAG: hypothetical protein PHG82_01590 [Candidatus Gracilibacteria bacterium]|nr:hypothetical protein [Candidatus Gracilibacteria bacterium]